MLKINVPQQLKISIPEQYFQESGQEIDWEGEDLDKVQVDQADEVGAILALEVSIHTLRRTPGYCGSLSDTLVALRRRLITEYEQIFDKYIEHQDFY